VRDIHFFFVSSRIVEFLFYNKATALSKETAGDAQPARRKEMKNSLLHQLLHSSAESSKTRNASRFAQKMTRPPGSSAVGSVCALRESV
jgi:hypothetical protein